MDRVHAEPRVLCIIDAFSALTVLFHIQYPIGAYMGDKNTHDDQHTSIVHQAMTYPGQRVSPRHART